MSGNYFSHKLRWLFIIFLFLPLLVKAQTTVPAAPSGLHATTATATAISLAWTDNATNEDKFNLDRKLTTATDWSNPVSVQLMGANITTYTDTSVTAGQSYDYRLQACLSGTGCSTYTYLIGVTAGTASGSTPPAPGYLNASLSGSSVNLTWAIVAAATHYNVARSPYPSDSWTSVCSTSGSANTSCTDISLASGTYYYRVEACQEGYGCSGAVNNQWTYSSAVTISDSSGGSCTGLALALSQTTYYLGEHVDYTWTCTPAGEASYVKVRLLKPDGTTVTANEYSGSASSLSLSLTTTNLSAGSYTLQACFTSACSPVTASRAFSLAPPAGNTPPAPGAPAGPATALVGETISVTAVLYSAGGEQLQAVVDWGDGGYFSFSAYVAASTSGSTSPPLTHNFTAAGIYNLRAKAKNNTGLESGWSGNFTITVTGAGSDVPAAPTNLRLDSATAARISLHWDDNAINEDKFNLERKLTTRTNWSNPVIFQLSGADRKEYTDTAIAAGTSYDYRVQACRSGVGCSAYTYLIGVTAGTTVASEAQPVTVTILNGLIVRDGLVAFVKDGQVWAAQFNFSASATVYLLPGVYDLQPSFPGVNSAAVQLTGAAVANGKLNMGTASTDVYVSLPVSLSVSVRVQTSAGEPISSAQVAVGLAASTVYASAATDALGTAWLQLPTGAYSVLTTRAGYLAKTDSLTVSTSGAELMVTLERLPLTVSGQVLAGTSPIAGAVVRAVNQADGSIVIVTSDSQGNYSLALKAASWQMSALAEGYEAGDSVLIELNINTQHRDLKLGAVLSLYQTSANIVPTVSVTVTAAELGVSLGLPAKALGSGASASVTIRESSHTVATAVAKPLPGSVRDLTAIAGGAAVTTLSSAAAIEFTYTEADLSAIGVGEAANLKLAFWDTTRSDWEVLASVVDKANRKVRASTRHFTLFAIVLPFLAQPASAEVTKPTEPAEATSERATQFAAIVAEGTKVYVSGPEALALSLNLSRNLELEQKYEADIVARVVGSDKPTTGTGSTIVNFVTYGTASAIHLGAGERGGVVASFRAAYGRLPSSEYDWQEVLKIANGRWPGTLLPEREQAMKNTFQKIYLRQAIVTNVNDSAALAIMAYGLRQAKRNLSSEAAAMATFQAVYGYVPQAATDWDAVRAIAYSGAKR